MKCISEKKLNSEWKVSPRTNLTTNELSLSNLDNDCNIIAQLSYIVYIVYYLPFKTANIFLWNCHVYIIHLLIVYFVYSNILNRDHSSKCFYKYEHIRNQCSRFHQVWLMVMLPLCYETYLVLWFYNLLYEVWSIWNANYKKTKVIFCLTVWNERWWKWCAG